MEILEVSLSSVKRWRKKVNEAGLGGLSRKSGTGRTSKLSSEHLADLKEIILKGALAVGYPTDRWTSRIVADLIRKKWNIQYCRSQVRKILNDLGLSYQKPDVRSTNHSQEVIDHWKRYDWKRIKKSGHKRLGAVPLG